MTNLWLMERGPLEMLARGRYEMNVDAAQVAQLSADYKGYPGGYAMRGETAVIPIKGVLQERYDVFTDLFGFDQTPPGAIEAAVRAADQDERVGRILLDVNSPGGNVAGIPAAARAVAEARKPTEARIAGVGASAAYWIASQADSIAATPESLVGSIGVMVAIYDESAAAEKAGVKVKVIGSGALKGAGTPGTEVTDEQTKVLQENVDAVAAEFVGAVARGRGVSEARVQEWASGRTWAARTADSLGLIDRVDDGAALAPMGRAPRAKGGQDMTTEHKEGQAPTPNGPDHMERFSALKAAFPDDLAFAVGQFEAGATVEQAKAAYGEVVAQRLDAANSTIAEQAAALDAKDSEIADLKGKLEAAQKAEAGATDDHPGYLRGSAQDAAGNGGGEGDFMALARAKAKSENTSVTAALRALIAADPDAHERWVMSQRKKGA